MSAAFSGNRGRVMLKVSENPILHIPMDSVMVMSWFLEARGPGRSS